MKFPPSSREKVQVVEVEKLANHKTSERDLCFVAEPISGEC